MSRLENNLVLSQRHTQLEHNAGSRQTMETKERAHTIGKGKRVVNKNAASSLFLERAGG